MIELSEWAQKVSFPDRPWLVLGKGPTFSHRHRFDLSEYNLLSLNHVVRELKVDIAHIIDIDVIEACSDVLEKNCDWLLVPRRPHRRFAAGRKRLEDFFADVGVLRRLDEAGRLVWYNAQTGPVDEGPLVKVRFFSSEAAVGALAVMGVKKIRTLGVDGGTDYSQAFDDLDTKTRLANDQPSFDLQFREIESIVKEHGIDFEPLIEPIRVFVGCDESQLVAAQVLEHSIRKRATRPVEFHPMVDLSIPTPKKEENRPRTGFSFFRFAIPELAGYRGRAVYLDADMQVFADMAELWEIPFGEHKVLCTYQAEPPPAWKDNSWFHPGRQMSVMLLDCSRLDWNVADIVNGLDEGRYTYQQLMFDLCVVKPEEIGDSVPPEWNSLEHFEEDKTKLIHYTVVPTQPWKNDTNPLGDLWHREYRDALNAGVLDPALVRKGVAKGFLDASLAAILPEGRASGSKGIPVGTRGTRWWWRNWNRLTRRINRVLGRT